MIRTIPGYLGETGEFGDGGLERGTADNNLNVFRRSCREIEVEEIMENRGCFWVLSRAGLSEARYVISLQVAPRAVTRLLIRLFQR